MRQAEAAQQGIDITACVRVERDIKQGPFTITAPGEPFPMRIGDKRKSNEMAHFLSEKHGVAVVTGW